MLFKDDFFLKSAELNSGSIQVLNISHGRTSSQFRVFLIFFHFFLEGRPEISEMRKNKQSIQAVKIMKEILKRQCHVIQNFLFLFFFCQTSLELKTFFFKNPSKSRFWLFDSSPYKIFLDFDFFKRTLGIQDIRDIRDPGQQGSGSRTIGIQPADIRDPGQ